MKFSEAELEEFAAILASASTVPRVKPRASAPSTLYDATYHLAVIAYAFEKISQARGSSRILAPWLKLIQFVTVRPALVIELEAWLRERKASALLAWSRMPKGYVGDTTHDSLVSFLAVSQVLVRDGDKLVPGPRYEKLRAVAQLIVTEKLFVEERRIIDVLAPIPQNLTALEGA